MQPIKFYRDDENRVVKERNAYSDSIFSEQYQKSILIFNNILIQQEKQENEWKANSSNAPLESPSIITFCGDRGEGKSLCMETVAYILQNKEADQEKKYVNKIVHGNEEIDEAIRRENLLHKIKLEFQETIAPAFFDECYNLIELILGQMYNKYLVYV